MPFIMFCVFIFIGYATGNILGAFIALVIWLLLAGLVVFGEALIK